MYKIDKTNCPKGWAYVIDFKGNKCFYGSLDECKKFIKAMEEG